jgi:hypothetical protein
MSSCSSANVSSRISFGSLSMISTRGLPAVNTRPLSALLSSSVSLASPWMRAE